MCGKIEEEVQCYARSKLKTAFRGLEILIPSLVSLVTIVEAVSVAVVIFVVQLQAKVLTK